MQALIPRTLHDPWLDSKALPLQNLADHGWFCLDGLFDGYPGLLAALRDEARGLTQADMMAPAGIGRGLDRQQAITVRRDRIAWLDGHSGPQRQFLGLLEQLRQTANRHLYLGLRRAEAQFARFGPGDFYRKHLDSFRGRASRLLSLVVYLNQDWESDHGGQLRIYHPQEQDRVLAVVEPLGGRAVGFMSEEMPHEVMDAHAERFSIACWFRCDGEENIASIH